MYETVKLQPGILTLTFVSPDGEGADAMIRPIVPAAARHAITLGVTALWIAAVVVLLATAFPWYAEYLF